MLFHSLQFIAFFAASFAGYWAVHKWRWPRLWVLLATSLVFYAAWSPYPLFIFFGYGVVNWLAGHALERLEREWHRKLVAAVAVALELAGLGLFKYADLFITTGGWLARKAGFAVDPQPLGLLLPVGLSFVAFQAISYVVDVYRRQLTGRWNLVEQLTYLLFFPQVVAGPIIRAKDLLEHFRTVPSLTAEDGASGLFRMAMGIAKKLLFADVLALALVDRVFADPTAYTSAECAVAAFAYTFQIYFDFSAYSDVAIGAARLFGFDFPENFNKPYHARNLFEFWNRWHISLSTWLRDYFYIPLGGNRGSKLMTLRNLMLVMVLGGLWHGAGWRFALWGGIHGVGLVLTRIWWWVKGKPKSYGVLGTIFGIAGTMVVVILSRVFFRSPDIPHALVFFRRLFELTPGLANVAPAVWMTLAGAVIAYVLPRPVEARAANLFTRAPILARAVALVALGLALRQVAAMDVQPYIYFQF